MTIYVYGVVRSEDEAPELSGLGDPAGSVQLVAGEDVAAVVSELPDDFELSEEDAITHLDVLNALAAKQAVLPLQFGTMAPDETAVRREVLAAPGLRASLDALNPFVELRIEFAYNEDALLREVVAEDPGIRESSGVTSLDGRVAVGQRIVERVENRVAERGRQLIADLDGIAESIVRLASDNPNEDKWALLVDRSRLGEADSAVRGIGRSAPDVQITYIGPMPTFSFLQPAVEDEPAGSRWGW